jgi:ArsR family transcriptional regulator
LILYALNEQPRNVTELVNDLGANQSTVSRHLKVLRDHGLVQTTRQGVCITYTLADTRLIKALDILRAVLHDSLTSKANLMVDERAF